MSTYTASDVFELSSALLNDQGQTLYTDIVQIPYLKLAHGDLENELDANDCEINLISELEISVPAGDIALSLPVSFFLPIKLQEKGSSDTIYSPMDEVNNVYNPDRSQGQNLEVWDYRHNCVNFFGATTARTVRLTYIRQLAEVVDQASAMAIRRAKNYYSYRTAALCARFIGGTPAMERANALDSMSGIALDALVDLYVKNNQARGRVRRKPFRIRQYYIGR